MKIDILTWYKANNHGAILQAYSSYKVLSNERCNVRLVDYDRHVSTRTPKFKRIINYTKSVLTGNNHRTTIKKFDKLKKEKLNKFIKEEFEIVSQTKKLNTIMVGSDMVFSFEQGYNPYMFGIGLNFEKIFSYAACAGGTDKKNVKLYVEENVVANALNNFTGIGCRDYSTKKFVEELTNRTDLIDNIDPVLLYGFEEEKEKWDTGKWKNHKKYILIYSYHMNMNEKSIVKQIKKIAEENNYSIVSLGYYHKWCDECINADPKEFIEIFNNASFVITDTFHGTVFSLICKKNFLTLIKGNGFKVRDLLMKCGLEKNIINEDEIYLHGNMITDFDSFDKWLIIERKNSYNYLMKQVN